MKTIPELEKISTITRAGVSVSAACTSHESCKQPPTLPSILDHTDELVQAGSRRHVLTFECSESSTVDTRNSVNGRGKVGVIREALVSERSNTSWRKRAG